MSRVGRRVGSGGAAHLLIVVALALGVLVMHGLGHPTAPEASAGTGGTPRHTAMTERQQMPSGLHEEVGPLSGAPAHSGTTVASDAAPDSGRHSGHPGPSMDMTSLCLAVLGLWMLGVLFGGLLSRARDRSLCSLARFLAGLRPKLPPPRAPDLLQLSVLRI
ncbi:hypothetical protein [Streptomyces sp. NPDC017993]|uniref:hypothetical protein n=1 Tax=Streptomyces sp. NPDC017993 TaxID=3365027 RepID=UPI003796755D